MKDNKIKKEKEIRILKEKIKELEKAEAKYKQAEDELRDSEIRYHNLFENSSEFLFTLDLKGNFTDVNNAAEVLTGYTKSELVKMNYKDYTPKRDHRKLFYVLYNIYKTGKPFQNFPVEAIIKDKSIKHFETSFNLMWKGEQIIGYQGSSKDITERKQAKEALEKSKYNYRILFDNVGDGVFVLDAETMKVVLANKAIAKMYGFDSEADIANINPIDFVLPEYKEAVYKIIAEDMFKNDLHQTNEFLSKTKDGREIWISAVGVRTEHKGRLAGLISLRDITKRKLMEEELKKNQEHLEELVKERTKKLEEKTKEIKESQQALSLLLEDVNESRAELKNLNKQLYKEIQERKLKEQRLEAKTNELNISLKNIENAKDNIDAILKSIGDGLIVTDLDNRIVLMNHVVEDLLNIRLSEVLNKSLLSIIKEENLRKKFDFTVSKVRKGYKFDFELLAKNAKHPNVYNAKSSIIKDKKDRAMGIIIVFRDVTREREIDRLKSEFISTAAHELRTPLTSIQGFSEILKIRDDLDDEKRKRFLTYINKQAINLGNIISDLLDISRIESGMGFSLKKEKCNINDCILRVFSIYKISHPNHSFYFYLPDKETEVYVDRVKMEQIIENILNNAVKYSPHGGEIRIKGKVLGNKYMVTLEDKGIGMTPEQVKRIYEKFFRGDSSDTAAEGTGLGMSIVKYIIEAHKGNIWVESKLGKGTKVCFTIPISIRL